jgi:hypothetical protein
MGEDMQGAGASFGGKVDNGSTIRCLNMCLSQRQRPRHTIKENLLEVLTDLQTAIEMDEALGTVPTPELSR